MNSYDLETTVLVVEVFGSLSNTHHSTGILVSATQRVVLDIQGLPNQF